MAEETVEIKIVQPIILHLIEEVLDILLLIGGDLIFVWRLDSNRITLVGSEPRRFLVCISIHLNQITARQGTALIVFWCHLRDIHTVLVDRHLVAQLVTAFVFAIEQHVDGSTIGCIIHTHTSAEFKGHQVAHQRLVAIVIDERPFLRFGRRIEHILFLVKLNPIGFLGEFT